MTNAGMPSERDQAGAAVDWTAGMPVGHHGSLTPMGEVEQVGKLAGGLIRLTGWRRLAVRLVVLAVLAFFAVTMIVGTVSTHL